ncbi:radical SAM protein [Sinorhizobium meliloti]|uniref:radical SAM/SPASM domain-containing protein n=1 Tax=Rhizobium meliloti TaxID=382 RepID=UPI00299F0C1E|nr:radical SAM protein [Sinorhizobium meliloti]MDW9389062.1 radical SAM protein [Sinorhizobium meliloti]MDW9395260.1 radical SAM protein [Sinorhizobium meliloti]MDW9546547.1 radical SAM protein [Sinorhizobium meliloti]MDW9603132.1 radical SAM protein [Sinorhizobium meliloti]
MPAFSRPEYKLWYNAFRPEQVKFARAAAENTRVAKLVFDLASTCNMGCSYCFADRGRYGARDTHAARVLSPEMAAAIVSKVLQQVNEVGHIKFFGGEPLLAIDAIGVVCSTTFAAADEGLLRRKPSFNVITNGTLFTNKAATVLRDYSIRMTISMDGPEAIHDAQRTFTNGRGTYKRICENILKFSEFGCKLGVLEAVFTPKHLEFGYSMLDLFKALEDKFSQFFEIIVVHPLDQPTLDALPSSDEKNMYTESMKEQAATLYEYIMRGSLTTEKSSRLQYMLKSLTSAQHDENLCGVGFDTITIKPDGAVYACYVFSNNGDFRYGNILDDAFWVAFKSGGIGKAMASGSRFRHEACNECDIQSTCTHCLSGMTSSSGMNSQLPDVNCDFNIGQIEGFLSMIAQEHDSGRFDQLCQLMTRT